MPAYDVQCKVCFTVAERRCSVAQFDDVVTAPCEACGGEVIQRISAPRTVFMREQGRISRFGEFFEHASPDGVFARSACELKDKCEEHGTIAKVVEDA